MKTKNKPHKRIVVKTTRIYVRIPQESKDIEQYGYYYAAQHKYATNRHWQYLPMLCNDVGYALEVEIETHYDKKERPIHEFTESREGISECSWLYIDLPNGETVQIQSHSDGSVYIQHGDKSWNMRNGAFGWGIIRPTLPKAQEDYEEYEEKIEFGREKDLTPEEQAEYERRSAEAEKEIAKDIDKYGNPRCVEYWYCGVLERVYDYDYVYADE